MPISSSSHSSTPVRSIIVPSDVVKTRDAYVKLALEVQPQLKVDADKFAEQLKANPFGAAEDEKSCLLPEYTAIIARLELSAARLVQAKDRYATAVTESRRSSAEFDTIVNIGRAPTTEDDISFAHLMHRIELMKDSYYNLQQRLLATLSPPLTVRLKSPDKKKPRRKSTSPTRSSSHRRTDSSSRRPSPHTSERHRQPARRQPARRSPAKAHRSVTMNDGEDYPSVKLALYPERPDDKFYVCPYCGTLGKHLEDYCTKKQTVDARLEQLKETKSCRLCLAPHSIEKHLEEYKRSECVHCGEDNHNRSLCTSKEALESRQIAYSRNY